MIALFGSSVLRFHIPVCATIIQSPTGESAADLSILQFRLESLEAASPIIRPAASAQCCQHKTLSRIGADRVPQI